MRTHRVVSPHGERDDPYYWLRDDTRSDPDMLAYLQAENADGAAYSDAVSGYAALGRDELREAARGLIPVTSGRG